MRTGGPVPKRSNERRRRNKVQTDAVQRPGAVHSPRLPSVKTAAGQAIHPVARRWYNAIRQSGQADFFEPTDWAAALFVVEAMSRNLYSTRFSAGLFGVVWNAMEALLTTEAARRRSRLEVERGLVEEEQPGVTAIEEYRQMLG